MATKGLRQAHICYFRDKCVVFARNCKCENLIQCDVQYTPCNSALLAQETLFQKSTFLPKVLQKVCQLQQILISRQYNVY